jgi:alpha/beta hydrolase fold
MNDNAHQDGIYPFPDGMQSREIETNGAKIHVRVGGHGPAVVMLHGFGTTGDMWGHLANALIEDHTVIAPDLRGLGLSSKPNGGYDKKNQAADVWGVLDALGVDTIELVTHDIGIMVGFAAVATLSVPKTRPSHAACEYSWSTLNPRVRGSSPWRRTRSHQRRCLVWASPLILYGAGLRPMWGRNSVVFIPPRRWLHSSWGRVLDGQADPRVEPAYSTRSSVLS